MSESSRRKSPCVTNVVPESGEKTAWSDANSISVAPSVSQRSRSSPRVRKRLPKPITAIRFASASADSVAMSSRGT